MPHRLQLARLLTDVARSIDGVLGVDAPFAPGGVPPGWVPQAPAERSVGVLWTEDAVWVRARIVVADERQSEDVVRFVAEAIRLAVPAFASVRGVPAVEVDVRAVAVGRPGR